MASTFILRRVDSKVWQRVKERAAKEGRTLRGVVTMLVTRYADGRITLNDGPPFRKDSAPADGLKLPKEKK